MNNQQSSALETMQSSDEIVHTLPRNTADALIQAGYVRAASLDPMPDGDNVPVNLTALGRGYSAGTPAPAVE